MMKNRLRKVKHLPNNKNRWQWDSLCCPRCQLGNGLQVAGVPAYGQWFQCTACNHRFLLIKEDAYYQAHYSEEMVAYLAYHQQQGTLTKLKAMLTAIKHLETFLQQRKRTPGQATEYDIRKFAQTMKRRLSERHQPIFYQTIEDFYHTLLKLKIIRKLPWQKQPWNLQKAKLKSQQAEAIEKNSQPEIDEANLVQVVQPFTQVFQGVPVNALPEKHDEATIKQANDQANFTPTQQKKSLPVHQRQKRDKKNSLQNHIEKNIKGNPTENPEQGILAALQDFFSNDHSKSDGSLSSMKTSGAPPHAAKPKKIVKMDWHQLQSKREELTGRGEIDQLMNAASQGATRQVIQLLSGGLDINACNEDGATALHQAAFFNREEVVALLLSQGADPFIKDQRGRMPLDLAKQWRFTAIVRLLRRRMRL